MVFSLFDLGGSDWNRFLTVLQNDYGKKNCSTS